MIREVKFRAWDKGSEYMHSNVQNGVYEDPDEWTEFSTVLGLERFEVMQYTGLKDKNGKEIFEGDIVSGWKDSHWHDGKDRVLKEVEWTDELAGFNIIQIEMRTCEVIGNIYENPELLEGTA